MLPNDTNVRLAAFAQLKVLRSRFGNVLPWGAIAEGFGLDGRHFHFATKAKGIFRPEGHRGAALSIKTIVARRGRERRYEDIAEGTGLFHYRMQGDDSRSQDNEALRLAFETKAPLIYFFGIAPGAYEPIWPAYVATFSPATLSCQVETGVSEGPIRAAEDGTVTRIQREYRTVETKRRVHQDAFRYHVLQAYEDRCAVCRLPTRKLLEAAHIVPDSDEQGVAEVPNGLSLCHLHHGAFDANLLGIDPDRIVHLAPSLLAQRDGPTLEHALKGFVGERIEVPRRPADRPRGDLLSQRFLEFRRVSGA